MDPAEQAVLDAMAYAQETIDWYDFYALLKLTLFRGFGIVSIAATIMITFLSATLGEGDDRFLSFRKKNLVAFLAALSALALSLASFFDWRGSWESHRVAQYKIESLLVEAKVTQIQLKENGSYQPMYALAREIYIETSKIKTDETAQFFRGLAEGYNNEK